MHKILFLQSHPIQYHSPLYDKLEQNELVEFKIYYCSDYGLSQDGKRFHPEFGELPNWDVDLVNGHTYEILKNSALKKGIFNGFFGLMNFGIYAKLKSDRPDVLVINGWNYFTMIWAVFCCKFLKVKVYARGDNSIDGDKQLSNLKLIMKHFLYGKLLFPLFTKIGYVGKKNKEFFESYGVKYAKLINLPHAIDNERFIKYYERHRNNKIEIRRQLGISSAFNVLFIGRLHQEKRIFDLIEAVGKIPEKVQLTIIGDGKLQDKVRQACEAYPNHTFNLIGFQNQEELLEYYITGDLMVLPSQLETWGLVVNEAMNFDLPIILSDTVGCAEDLCQEKNGYIYKMGDVNSLSSHIDYLTKNSNIAKKMGVKSGEIVKDYSYESIIKNLIQSL
ncbi:glycosyltransferase family 4 protein [Subsaximicrobium wynnwilliamsii]|uniref:Glycosyltransferase family 4 protein n=1 Tax=Subsaximicrobium wynnwilliamsii TaxID=291179 RepID=A0A5C6ZIN8_9FLAO|nr:glycosyltransferase family 4 protein [Subsaximicrobium wynnwilliamsii]TXD81369.1 glycosyltransferase family 4 protein [Subsaximicrobium wynnwilliamsii]TXD89065.1 glycosyltransferase family 4 protein [Subsaximicrobium wynnwilliamsii]TXE00743.1 glycosyltransferase family 4 protein [Subsaximicrobium wynnwilliamsii]